MDKKALSQILHNRADNITEDHWNQLLEDLEKRNLYLCIKASSSAITRSASGEFIPMLSKGDSFEILTKEELDYLNLSTEHHIIKPTR
jgi:hypothetical protein